MGERVGRFLLHVQQHGSGAWWGRLRTRRGDVAWVSGFKATPHEVRNQALAFHAEILKHSAETVHYG